MKKQRIAVIADIHLSDVPGTAQEAAFTYALHQLQKENPAVVIAIGDVTAAGTFESANRIRSQFAESELCFRMILGNSDERTPDQRLIVAERLTVDAPFYGDEFAVCLLDIRNGKVSRRGRERLKKVIETAAGRAIVLGSHYPPEIGMKDASVRSWIEAGTISLFIGGHTHRDQKSKIGKMSVYSVRGLDPDKAIGGPPAIALFERKDQGWCTSEILFKEGTANGWSSSMRQKFIDHLGFSCMSNSLEGLHDASQHHVRCVELRAHHARTVEREALINAVSRWRHSGGRHLSMHMTELGYSKEDAHITGVDAFRDAVSLAVELEVTNMTVHVPRASVKQMQLNSQQWDHMAATVLELLKEPIARGVIIGIENLHMRPDEPADQSRGFGYLPAECHAWVRCLRKISNYDRIGIHLDIGHARNNPPFSKHISVGQWYALVGKEVVGYHLHQVTLIDHVMKNHQPITDMYGPLISFSSFLWSWKSGRLSHAPMYLEIRNDNLQTTIDSLQYIRQCLSGQNCS